MTTSAIEMAASGALTIGPFIVGLGVLVLLLGGFWLGDRIRSRESAPPKPEEQPHLPPEGAVHGIEEAREPEEVPNDGRRRMPYEFGNLGTRPGDPDQPHERPRWSKGSSGSFGGGGL
ncbi:DUF6479 family protein, partial [Streptomyces sp. MS06]|uniref:DUF6479 family protein n=1 Tax=Streptomyces sp. MS06 TaxID=3385974 RepID=UPI0039A11E01